MTDQLDINRLDATAAIIGPFWPCPSALFRAPIADTACANQNHGPSEAGIAIGPSLFTDVNLLNLALNLQYLRAEFHLRAAFGYGLSAADIVGHTEPGPVRGGARVPFNDPLPLHHIEVAATDALRHVRSLRRLLGERAVSRPSLDLAHGFATAARIAGLCGPRDAFDAFANERNALLAAFLLADIGVAALNRLVAILRTVRHRRAVTGILAAEAFHAGTLRGLLATTGLDDAADRLSALSPALSDPADHSDQGGGTSRFDPARPVGHGPDAVLSIVYLGGSANRFGFFPRRMHGAIR